MAVTAADVPSRFDLVLSGGSLSTPLGLVFLDALEPSLPFRTHRAIYGYSPTFIERANTSGSFGDNQQDFFLTSSQKDWSLGDGQRYARVNDADSARRYWQSISLDVVSEAGKATLRGDSSALTFAAFPTAIVNGLLSFMYVTTSTTLYTVSAAGTITSKGAHGLGVTPTTLAVDQTGMLYISGDTAKIRKFNGTVFADFSLTAGATILAYLNNTLYGYRKSTGDLVRFDTAGAVTSLFTWKGGDGGVLAGQVIEMVPFGGKLAMLLFGEHFYELWIYDGTAPAKIAELPPNFVAKHLAVALGGIYVSGYLLEQQTKLRPAVWYFLNGSDGFLWRSAQTTTTVPAIPLAPFADGLVFTDDTRSQFVYWSGTLGGTHAIATSGSSTDALLAASSTFLLWADKLSTAGQLAPTSAIAASGTLTSSLFDFDSSLNKFIRAIIVDFDSATDGNGGTVDIAYRVGDVDGSYTSLQTGAVSGTEYILTGISGHSVSVKVTLNKGTSTSGPVLKRVSVRAAPILTSYRTGEYVLDCTGDAGRSPRTLRDGTPNPLAGFESLAQLQIAKASTTPLTVTDRTGTYTGIVEQLEAYEEHPGIDDPTRSGEFVVKLIMRGI